MVTMTEKIFNELSSEKFEEEVHNLLELLKQNKDRIYFVDDTEKTNNFLILSTKEAIEKMLPQEIPYLSNFLLIDKQTGESKHSQHFVLPKIEKMIKEFFEKTTHTLFVHVLFEGSVLQNENVFEMYYMLANENCTINEAYTRIQKLPEFYKENCFGSAEITAKSSTMYSMLENERLFLEKTKRYYYLMIENAIISDELYKVTEYKTYINKIENQIAENQKRILKFK